MAAITIYEARRILTMDRNRPEATHVAVRDGRVLAVGGPDCAARWGEARLDRRFADLTMLPGLVEAHAHVSAGGVWRHVYCGHYDRTDPEGALWKGLSSTEAVVERLARAAAADRRDGPVIGWGFTPNFVSGPPLDRAALDRVAADRPVVALHSNFHLLSCNGAALAAAGMEAGSNLPGVERGPDGRPTGVLQEFDAMGPVMAAAGIGFRELGDAAAVRAYGRVARNCGVTTVADLLSTLDADEVDMLAQVTADPDFPCRYVPVMNAMTGEPEEAAARALALRPRSTDKLRLGAAKLFTDGAIQGYTALLKWPGYYQGEDHGALNMTEAHFRAAVIALHRAGVKTHVHANGDAASELAIDAFETAARLAPVADHRHTIEHAQLADAAQFRRMRALGLTVNLFANHLHYFGDAHWTRTLGPDRARRMDACRDALEILGLFAIHSDAPVTPMAPLVTAWCAVERMTMEGRRLGEAQRIPVEAALRSVTLGAAHVLKLDHEIGSIETGKRADFCLLEDDPLAVEPAALKDVAIAATVLGGAPTGS